MVSSLFRLLMKHIYDMEKPEFSSGCELDRRKEEEFLGLESKVFLGFLIDAKKMTIK